MSFKIHSLGRETPFSLSSVGDSGHLMVAYGDGLALYHEDRLFKERHFSCQAAVSLSDGSHLVAASDGKLVLLGRDLVCMMEVASPSQEETFLLVPVSGGRLLAVSEGQEVSCWEFAGGKLSCLAQWVNECQPLFAKGASNSVLCEERGRIQERDAKTGTILKTWPKNATGVWGVGDLLGQHGLLVNSDGDGVVLDLSGTEVLFHLECEFPISRGCFSGSGLEGAVLGVDGEVATFKITDGGACRELATPEIPLLALTYLHSRLLGLDENGQIWQLGGDPALLGGEWAGWGTSTLWLSDQEVLVGTAHGTVETFSSHGERKGASVQLHHDAVLSLERWEQDVISVGADATVCRLTAGSEHEGKTIASFPGRSVVGSVLCPQAKRLWLALDEGLVTWLSLEDPKVRDEIEIPGRRIEEIRSAGDGGVLVITDRGSVRYLSHA